MMTEIQAVMELHLSKSLSHISVRKCVNLPTLFYSCQCGPQGDSVSLAFSSTSQSHHTALCHLGSPTKYLEPTNDINKRSQSYSSPLPPSTMRRQKLLAVRTLFQKAYRTAVPELQPAQGAMAFATGLLSRLPLFGSSSSSTQQV
jgi:hypothetical protein